MKSVPVDSGRADTVHNRGSDVTQHSSTVSGSDGAVCNSAANIIIKETDKVELKRSITFFGVVAILIANTGGTGIFIAPTTVLYFSGSPGMAVIMWMLGGLVHAGLAFCVLEVSQLFNKSGGPYYYIHYLYGEVAGFVFMWGYIIFLAAPLWALGSYTASLYFLSLFYQSCPPSEGIVKLVAAWIIVTLVAVNCTYIKVITRIQTFLTSCKVIALFLVIILGVIKLPSEEGQENLKHFMDGSTTDIGKISLALFAGYFGFGGW